MANEKKVRVFERTVNGVTKTRRVSTPQDEVQAKWDGFTEVKPATTSSKTTTGGSGAGTTNSGAGK